MYFVIFPQQVYFLIKFILGNHSETVCSRKGQMAEVLPAFPGQKRWVQEEACWVGIIVVQISPW